MNGGHLGREHSLQLIVRFDARNHSKHEINLTLVATLGSRQLADKRIGKTSVCRAERFLEERPSDVCVRMYQRYCSALSALLPLDAGRGRFSIQSFDLLAEHSPLGLGWPVRCLLSLWLAFLAFNQGRISWLPRYLRGYKRELFTSD